MFFRISPITLVLLSALMLSACKSILVQKNTLCNPLQAKATYSNTQRDTCIQSLKQEIKSCLNQTYCAEINYKIAIAYLNSKSLNRSDLIDAARHMNKAVQSGEYAQHARTLNKILLGWINESRQSKKLRETNQKLQTKMERSKAVDLEQKHQ